MRRLARLLPLLTVLLLVAIAAAVLLHTGPLVEHLRRLAETTLSRELDRQISIGGASISLTGRVVLTDVVVRNDDGSVLLDAPVVEARLGNPDSLIPLLSRPTELRSIRLKEPEVNLLRRADGRWSVSDLLDREKEAREPFRAAVTAEEARVTLVDDTRGGQVTAITGAAVSYRSRTPTQTVLTVRAPANEGAFEALDVRAETDAKTGRTRLRGSVKGLHLPYAMERGPALAGISIAAGLADVRGDLSFGGDNPGGVGPQGEVTAEVREAEVGFPWLRCPVQQVEGRVRLSDRDLRLDGVRGVIEGAPIELSGVIRDLADPELALAIEVTGIRYPQLRALFPRLAFPAGLLLPSPLRVIADIEGPFEDVRVTGQATVKVIRFRAVPWHDLVGRFEYQDGRLKISGLRAHGSPRRFEAEIEIDLRQPAPTGSGTVAVANLPLDLLARMAGIEGDFRGIAQATVHGQIDGESALRGDFRVEDAVVEGIPLGRLDGRFEYADGAIRLPQVRVRGPAGEGVIDALVNFDGAFRFTADFTTLDLASVGPALRLTGVQGKCCARVEARGQARHGAASVTVRLGPGQVHGRTFESLTASVAVGPERIEVRQLHLAMGAGSWRGGLLVTNWRDRPETARLSGRLEVTGAELMDAVPATYRSLVPRGPVDGSIDLGGTLADPTAAAEFRSDRLAAAGWEFEAARARARYEGGRLVVEEIALRTADDQLALTGGYRPETGLAFDFAGRGLELNAVASALRTGYGLALEGEMDVTGALRGPLDRPEIGFSARAPGMRINQIEFDSADAAGRIAGGVITVESASLRRGESALSVSGSLDTGADRVAATVRLEKVELGTLVRIGDSAVWRLYHAGVRHPLFRSYAQLPRPLAGRLTTTVHLAGPLRRPAVEARLDLEDLSFNGRSIEHIEGEIKTAADFDRPGAPGLREAKVDFTATHEMAVASLVGQMSPKGELEVVLDVGNLDLRLLNPWLQLPIELGGQATVNFDFDGTVQRPLVRGDIFVDDLQLGPLRLEAAAASPIRVQQGVLSVEEVRLRSGPMQGIGSVLFPLNGLAAIPLAELHLTEASFTPVPGMEPARFDADVYLIGNRLLLRNGQRRAGAEAEPGIRGTMGAGSFAVSGEIAVTQTDLADWGRNAFDVQATFDGAQVLWQEAMDVRLDGAVSLVNDPQTGEAVVTTAKMGPLVVSRGRLGVPEMVPIAAAAALPFAPKVDVRVLVGEDLWFEYDAGPRPTRVRVQPGSAPADAPPSGHLDLAGRLSAEDLRLQGQFESREGRLGFPNGVLTLRRATAWVQREPNRRPVVTVSAEADGRVGDYSVSLSPSGQIYPLEAGPGDPPAAPLALNLGAIPHLEEAYVMALLVGPVVAPTRAARPDIATLLADPTRTGAAGGEITGIRLPPFGNALGMQEFSLDVALEGPVQLRLGQRIFERLVVSYASTLTGPTESQALRFNYEVTPQYSIGWSVNELDQTRWEVNAFLRF